MTWQIGDLVKLKSGGPTMTVSGVDLTGRAICEWFDDKHSIQIDYFASNMLENVEPQPRKVGN